MWGARYEALKAVLRPLWVRIVAPFALLYGTYDSTAHQFLPPETAEKFPTIYGLVSMTSGWFPWWIWLLVVIAIFFFAVIDYVARSQHAAHRSNGPAPAIPAPTTMAAPLQASPDWSLRELFFWICPELQTNAESKDREAIGREIMDKLSTGQLSAWGRRIKWPDRRREPLAPIDREYWSRSEFTYWFLKEDGDQVSSQAVPRILSRPSAYAVHDPDYADIQINKAQALTLWAAHRVGYREAATLLYEAMERSGVDDMTASGYSNPITPLTHFKYVLKSAPTHDDAITLYGARSPSRQSTPIPPNLLAQLEPSRKDDNGLTSMSRAAPIDYQNVWISRRDLDRVIKSRIALLRRVNKGLNE